MHFNYINKQLNASKKEGLKIRFLIVALILEVFIKIYTNVNLSGPLMHFQRISPEFIIGSSLKIHAVNLSPFSISLNM